MDERGRGDDESRDKDGFGTGSSGGASDDGRSRDADSTDTGSTDLGADWLMSQLSDTGVQGILDDESDSTDSTEGDAPREGLRRRFRRRRAERSEERERREAERAREAAAQQAQSPAPEPESPEPESPEPESPEPEAPESETPESDGEPESGGGPERPAVQHPESEDQSLSEAQSPPEPEDSSDSDDFSDFDGFSDSWLLSDEIVETDRESSAAESTPGLGAGFFWNLTPNDEADPEVPDSGRRSSAEAPQGDAPEADADEGAGQNREPDQDRESDQGREPDQGAEPGEFDPFADHEPTAVESAMDRAFASPDAYDRLYDEATLSDLDERPVGDEAAAGASSDADEDADADEADAEADNDTDTDSGTDADADTDAGTDAEADGEPREPELPTDLGILDLFSRRSARAAATSSAAAEPAVDPERPAAETPTTVNPTVSEPTTDTNSKLRALFDTSPKREASPAETPTAASPTARSGAAAPSGRGGASGSGGTKPGTIAVLAVVAVVVLGGLFWFGTLIPGMLTPSQAQAPVTSSPTPTETLPESGTLPAGTYSWDQLRGGECLDDYSSPWAEEFTVVDCDDDHTAQLIAVGAISDDEDAEFPGQDELASKIYMLCSADGVIDMDAAGEYDDVQVQGTYPVNEEQWDAGQRDYFCFVNRASDDPLSGSLVGSDAPGAGEPANADDGSDEGSDQGE